MPASDIVIRGAREHNLRDVDVTLPRNQLICLTGVSGSGKSSLAFDTLFAEGQRRYIESLSTFARQFLGQMPKPDVDHISGLSPSISIAQKQSGTNPRSTVGTITEIYDFLRVLFARVGQGHCPQCGEPITAQSREQILGRILALPKGTRFSVLAPVVRQQKGEHRDLFEDLLKKGFVRARIDGEVHELASAPSLDRQMRHDIQVVVDRLKADPASRGRLAESVETALGLGEGALVIAPEQEDTAPVESDGEQPPKPKRGKRKAGKRADLLPGDIALSADFACGPCGLSFDPPSPQLFSFNSPQGMCETCDGLGELYTFDPKLLIEDGTKTFASGAIALVDRWRDLGRWKRHIYKGVADTMERKLGLEEGTLLETPWEEMTDEWRNIWLWGTGDEHITFTWRAGRASQKYGGEFDGVIPELLEKYRTSQSQAQLRRLEKFMRVMDCPDCAGRRLNAQASNVRLTTTHDFFIERGDATKTLPDVCGLPVDEATRYFEGLRLSDAQQVIAAEVLKEVRGRLGFLEGVGLGYLSLDRTAPTLSGGESQRIRLAGQVGCGLVGVTYVLDEPSIGLHARDNQQLIDTLCRLRDMGNTVVVVEHDEDTMRAADLLIDFGPGPGVKGGEVVAVGPAEKVAKEKRSQTGAYLGGKREIAVPETRRVNPKGERGDAKGEERTFNSDDESSVFPFPHSPLLRVVNATHNNLKNVTVEIPLGAFVCVTGVSGSGKSSVVNDILMEALRRDVMKGKGEPGAHERIDGVEHLDKVISIDQSPIGRTPRSNPGTYIKVFDDIRALYAQLPESKRRGYKPGRFSFNVAGGRCEACDGNGANKLEMDFLADVWVTCQVCSGKRFNRETLQVEYKGVSIADALEMDIVEALAHFEAIPNIRHKLETLHAVGLDYLKLGQPSPTLSGGEAQRIKLAKELVKKSTGKTLYMLDEPTTGLHFADIDMLLKVLHGFVDQGNTVLVIEHNLDVVKTADWIIDIGPEGGAGGGEVVAAGTPEQIVGFGGTRPQSPSPRRGGGGTRVPNSPPPLTPPPAGEGNTTQPTPFGGEFRSHTAEALAPLLNGKSSTGSPRRVAKRAVREAKAIEVRGARQHNLRGVDAKIPREQFTVFCGPSGSGKSSLAMDTIYAEGQRRYVESLGSYARQFVGQIQKPSVEHVEGLSPAIAIEQRTVGHTPRSTVGTVTEIYDYFRVLMARLGQPYCPDCEEPIGTQTSDDVTDKVMAEPNGAKLQLMAPVEVGVGDTYEQLFEELRLAGYRRVRVDGTTHELENPPKIDRRRRHDVAVVVDRITVQKKSRARIAEAVEAALGLGRGVLQVVTPQDDVPEHRWPVRTHSQHLSCESCGRSFEPLTPHNFSFNSTLGWCGACEGLGTQTGANPMALLRDEDFTLAEGALLLWPSLRNDLAKLMLAALAKQTDIPLDTPYRKLNARQRRSLLYGTKDEWIEVAGSGKSDAGSNGLRFKFKGLYPALEEASRLSPSLRTQLEHLVDEIECSECGGSRLRDDASAVRFRGLTIEQIVRLPLGELIDTVKKWRLDEREKKIAGEIVREIKNRLTFLVEVGLEYLTLGRQAPSLSGGESQRIRLASQVGSGLTGVLYVLDEPTIGLHPRDNTRLIAALTKLRDLGNTLLVVEHDKEVVASADRLMDFGPAAGKLGGEVVAEGTPAQVGKKRKSVTGPYLSGKKAIPVPKNRRIDKAERGRTKADDADAPSAVRLPPSALPTLRVVGARHNNLKHIDVDFPLGALIAVTGVSGSGKSSLVNEVLYNQLARTLHRAGTTAGAHDRIEGVQHINKVIRVDQSALGNSPASNPATYTGAFDLIRQLFAQLPEAKLRGYQPRRFSFNVAGGRCDDCEGMGQQCVEMHFLPDVWVECETCRGQRYNPETLAVRYREKSIADVLRMSAREALGLFENIPKIRRVLQTLCDVGLDYVALGQPAPTLSGGEAQRVKLAAELSRPDTGQTLYLLDEPTTGLHFDDLAKLLDVLHRLVDLGNTVLVIEHNLDVIKQADWVIDIGPEAGKHGGEVVVCGTPEEIVEQKGKEERGKARKREAESGSDSSAFPIPHSPLQSHTAAALAPVLAEGPYKKRKVYRLEEDSQEGDIDLDRVGEGVDMPWEADGRRWHCVERICRDGAEPKWQGKVLDQVERRIQQLGDFAPTNWNHRSVVEITGHKKADGWFFHALTGEKWLVKLKFRTAKRTFNRDELAVALDLKPLNDIDDIEAYGSGPRVKCKNLRGPWQEIQIAAHAWKEIDTPAFWEFVEKAVAGFEKFVGREEKKPEDLMPWKVLGQKWHLARKGFTPGKKVAWETDLLEELLELIDEASPGGEYLWNNKVLVHRMVPGRSTPWATLVTKRAENIELALNGPKGEFNLGQFADLAADRELDTRRDDRDTVRLRFVEPADLERGDLAEFVRQHRDGLSADTAV